MTPYYSENGITIYHGDSLDVMAALNNETVDQVLTSPPYNMGNSAGGGIHAYAQGHYRKDAPMGSRGGSGRWKTAALANGYGSYSDDMPHDEYVTWQKLILKDCYRLLSPTGAIYYNHKQRIFNGEVVTPLAYNPDLPVRQIVIWARAGGINCNPTYYMPTHEWIVIFAKPRFRLKSKSVSSIGDVWYIPQEANPSHPAPFPLSLAKRAIETTPATLILDPFMGSGTVLRAAKDLGRQAIGIELNEAYCENAARWLSQEVLQFV